MRTLELFALTAAAVATLSVVAVSCAPLDQVAEDTVDGLLPPPFPDGTPPPPGRQWVLCDVLAGPDSESATVTPGQAQTLVLDGGHRLRIPANALDRGAPPVQITFRQRPGRGVAVILVPANQEFDNPLTLTLVYGGRDCDVPQPTALDVFRLRTDPPHEHQLVQNSVVDEAAASITVEIDHFTTFSIAR